MYFDEFVKIYEGYYFVLSLEKEMIYTQIYSELIKIIVSSDNNSIQDVISKMANKNFCICDTGKISKDFKRPNLLIPDTTSIGIYKISNENGINDMKYKGNLVDIWQ